ncbi:LysR family transcriptional regulator [Vibrio methylphosphonaticus]|uniref:LysR family transcriptional regulator n=1 Tax=Vibrio methylphosphonaticus TaxID=2946866 RepID=UPI00202A1773|nr:LysR family transcriptional regulator [Vibrio methylphosphonaticus]MCL9774093.1 LysR family transcriptional regulator [Vibrio methylphosphonaticus]
MAKDLFSNLDLNLLRTFIILNQERNMRKAAERLFVSQPAVSKALQRLRDHFGDELFVKTHHGLRATEKANILAESVSPILDELSNAVNHSSEFDPSELDGTVKIAISPFFLSSIASKLFQSIRKEAPNVQIQLLNWNKTTLQDIVNDDVQLGLNYSIAHAPKELVQTQLTTDTFRAYMRKDHPFDKNEIEMHDGGKFEIATLIAADWNSNLSNTEKMLIMRGIEPNVVFRSELPSAVIDVVKHSDILFPASMFLNLEDNSGLRSLPILFGNEGVNTDINTFFHYKNRNNATTQWLRKKLHLTLTT